MKKAMTLYVFLISIWIVTVSAFYANGQSVSPTALFEDFQVNENAGGAEQVLSQFYMNEDGSYQLSWLDDRRGLRRLFLQRFDNGGIPLGENFELCHPNGCAEFFYPHVTHSVNGKMALVWKESGTQFLFTQLYSTIGEPLGNPQLVNFLANDILLYQYDITMAPDGNYLVFWYQLNAAGNGSVAELKARRFDKNGIPTGAAFQVNDVPDSPIPKKPFVAGFDGNGNFVIAWEDKRQDSRGDIFCQRYRRDGTPVGSNIKANNNAGSSAQYSPKYLVDRNNNYTIAWLNGYGIYAQTFDSTGQMAGNNFLVYRNPKPFYSNRWGISRDSTGNTVVTWVENNDQNYLDVYGKRLDPNGLSLGERFKVHTDSSLDDHIFPVTASDMQGNFIIAWSDFRNGRANTDIYARRYDSNGNPYDVEQRVNDDIGSSQQSDPAVAVDGNGNIIVTWLDFREPSVRSVKKDIYAHRYDRNGQSLGNDFRVNETQSLSTKAQPDITVSNDGRFVIAWWEGPDVFVQRFDSNANPAGTPIKVNTQPTGNPERALAITGDGSGDFVIAWNDQRNGHCDIYYQRLAADGTPLGNNFRVNHDNSDASQWRPTITQNAFGDITITWLDNEQGDNVMARRFTKDGGPLGPSFRVNPDIGAVDMAFAKPAIASDDNGNFTIVWLSDILELKARRFDRNGNPDNDGFRVNLGGGLERYSKFAISMQTNGYGVITWQDFREGISKPDIYAQRFGINGEKIEGNFRITNTQSGYQKTPDVTLRQNHIHNVWVDNRAGSSGFDVWANVLDFFVPTGIGDGNAGNMPADFGLFQNYPNPFNPTTTIRYRLTRPADVQLRIYNIVGQKVRTLINEQRLAGEHTVQWDGRNDHGTNVPSGVYLYKLETSDGQSLTRKMVLLK